MKATKMPLRLIIMTWAAAVFMGCQAQTAVESSLTPPGAEAPLRVVQGEILVEVEAPVSSSPAVEAVLRSPAKGNLVSVPAVGQRVTAGEVVARLDTEALDRAIAEASISVEEVLLAMEKQTQTLEILRRSLASDQTLAQAQLITQEAFASAQANLKKEEIQYQSLRLSLKKAQLALEDAKENRADAWIKSPVTGIISSVSEDGGTYVVENTEICRVVDISTITLTGQVDEYDIGKVAAGQPAQAVFEALKDRSFRSQVRTVSPTARLENNVPVYSVTAEVSNPGEIIRPGMSGDLRITVTRSQGLVVPKEAVSAYQGSSYVEIMENGESARIPVETGPDDGKQILILSGLREGQILAYRAPGPERTSTGSGTRGSAQTSRPASLMGIGSGPGAGGPPPGAF